MHNRRARAVAVFAVVAALSGCGGDDETGTFASTDTATVVTALYPLAFVIQEVGGAAVTVSNLASPGVEPHDIELSPQQVGAVADSALVVYLDGFSPAFDESAEQNASDRLFEISSVVDLEPSAASSVSGDEEHGGTDPHFWLDPVRLADLAEAVANRLAEMDPDHAGDFDARAESLVGELTSLDAAYESGLAECATTTLVTSHEAFGYLTRRYGLEQVSIAGLEPDAEPSAARIVEVQRIIRATGTTTIFFEPLATSDVADSIAADLGVTAAMLDPIESQPAGGDYLTQMTENLRALREGLRCT